MKINTYRSKLFLFYSLIILVFAVLISSRDLSIGGSDPLVYKRYFERMANYQIGDRRFEIGYHLFNITIRKLTDNYQIFLITFYFTFNLIYFRSMVNLSKFKGKTYFLLSLLLFLGLSLNSSWYISATINGLRQGYSLVLFYLALSYAPLNNKLMKFKFLIILILSLTFHDSTLLIVPFLILILVPLKLLISIFLLITFFYPPGINEVIIREVSSFTGVPVYFEIASYSEGNSGAKWVGFQLDFFIYSLFWCLLFIFLHFRYLKNNIESQYILKILIILTSVYFFYGFGAFSNRFGFMSWLFLPIIQTFYISKLMISKTKDVNIVFLVFISVLAMGIINYYLLLRPIL